MPLLVLFYSTTSQTLRGPGINGTGRGPWTSILTTLFPFSRGYIISLSASFLGESHIPDLVLEVLKLTNLTLPLLIVKVENSQDWRAGIPSLERQIKRQTITAFSGSAVLKVYWKTYEHQ